MSLFLCENNGVEALFRQPDSSIGIAVGVLNAGKVEFIAVVLHGQLEVGPIGIKVEGFVDGAIGVFHGGVNLPI